MLKLSNLNFWLLRHCLRQQPAAKDDGFFVSRCADPVVDMHGTMAQVNGIAAIGIGLRGAFVDADF